MCREIGHISPVLRRKESVRVQTHLKLNCTNGVIVFLSPLDPLVNSNVNVYSTSGWLHSRGQSFPISVCSPFGMSECSARNFRNSISAPRMFMDPFAAIHLATLPTVKGSSTSETVEASCLSERYLRSHNLFLLTIFLRHQWIAAMVSSEWPLNNCLKCRLWCGPLDGSVFTS